MKRDFREKTSRPGEPLTPLTSEEARGAAEDGHVTPWDTSKGRKLTCPRSLFGAYDARTVSKLPRVSDHCHRRGVHLGECRSRRSSSDRVLASLAQNHGGSPDSGNAVLWAESVNAGTIRVKGTLRQTRCRVVLDEFHESANRAPASAQRSSFAERNW